MLAALAAVVPSPFTLPASAMLVGCSTTSSRGQTTAQSMAAMVAAAGPQGIHRVYANDTYATFNTTALIAGDYDSSAKAPIRATHLSWNPLMLTLQSENTSAATASGFDPSRGFTAWKASGYVGTVTGYGTETTKNIMALRTIPDNHLAYLNPCHEADEYQASRDYGTNYAGFRAGFRIIADIIHAFGNPTWKTVWLLTAYAFKNNAPSSRLPSNFWPAPIMTVPTGGLAYVDVVGVDTYNEGGLSGSQWDSPAAGLGIPLDIAEQTQYAARYGGYNGWRTTDAGSGLKWDSGFLGWTLLLGLPFIIGEVGTHLNHKGLTPSWLRIWNLSNSKQDWIRALGYFLAKWNSMHATSRCLGVSYFMSAGRAYAGPAPISATASGLIVDPAEGLRNASTGVVVPVTTGAATSGALKTTGNTTGDMAWVPSSGGLGEFWRWSGTAWVDSGIAGMQESWQEWWNEWSPTASGWDSATTSGYVGQGALVTRFGVAAPVPPAVGSPSPANAAMPVGRYVAADGGVYVPIWSSEFNTDVAVGGDFTPYGPYFTGDLGQSTSNGSGTYLPAEVLSVAGGNLHWNLHYNGSKFAVAKPAPTSYQGFLYGSCEISIKVQSSVGAATLYKVAGLLWPDSGNWADGEIDWAENDALYSSLRLASVHTGTDADFLPNPKQYAGVISDGKFHTVRVEWAPTFIKWYFDGVLISTVTDKNYIPSVSMHPFLQVEPAIGQTPTQGETATVDVAWCVVSQLVNPTFSTPTVAKYGTAKYGSAVYA